MNHKIIIAIPFVLLLFLACGGPAVQHSSISGDVKQVELWKIDYSPMHKGGTIDSALMKVGEIESIDPIIQEHSDKYARDVRYELEKKGYLFTENLASQGTITLKLQWLTRQEAKPAQPGVLERKMIDEERERRGLSPNDTLSINSDYLAWKLFGENYIINWITVAIGGSDGKLLGEVIIKTEPFEHIDPDFTAKVIDKIITEGEY